MLFHSFTPSTIQPIQFELHFLSCTSAGLQGLPAILPMRVCPCQAQAQDCKMLQSLKYYCKFFKTPVNPPPTNQIPSGPVIKNSVHPKVTAKATVQSLKPVNQLKWRGQKKKEIRSQWGNSTLREIFERIPH